MDSKIIIIYLLADSVIWIHKVLPVNKAKEKKYLHVSNNMRGGRREQLISKSKFNLTSQLSMLGYPAMDLSRSATSNEIHHDHRETFYY
jgi:hypothetical protein